jgi:HAE1 family hydrophobic/amphiphilic exporter-1
MNIEEISIKRPTFVISMFIIVLLLGIISFKKLSVRMFPDAELPYIVVLTSYYGAGVTEISELVTKPIEDTVSGISELKHVKSISEDSISIVICEFKLSKKQDIASQEVKDKIEQIKTTLPKDIEQPIVMKADINNLPLVTIALKSENMNRKELYDFAENNVSKEFSKISGVSNVNIIGGLKREIHVKIDKEKIKKYELNLISIAKKIEANSLNVPLGTIYDKKLETAFITIGEFKKIQQIGDVVLNFINNDIPVLVNNVGYIEDGVITERSKARLDIKKNNKILYNESLFLNIYRQPKGNDVNISNEIKKKIKELNNKFKTIDNSPSINIIFDSANGIRRNIAALKNTIIEGTILAIIVVYLFLGNWRSTFITALSIPTSLIGSFIFIYIFGFSLNIISLMSLSLAVGLLIDDAIVVRENIFRHYEKGENPIKSAIFGTREVKLAVIATTSTVIAVFLPISFLSGVLGKFFKEFGLTIIFAMIISIIDAFTIAPMLSAYIIPKHNKEKKINRTKEIVVKNFRLITVDLFNKFMFFFEKKYKNIVFYIIKKNIINFKLNSKKNIVISYKFIILFTSMIIFFITIFITNRYIKTAFIPHPELDEFNINIEASPGTSLIKMDEYTKEVEKLIINDRNIEFIASTVGSSDIFSNLSNESNIYVKIVPRKKRVNITKNKRILFGINHKKHPTTLEIKENIRKILNKKFSDKLSFSIMKQSLGNHKENEFVIELSGDNINILYEVSKKLINRYINIKNLVDLQSNYKFGNNETQILINSKKMKDFGINSVSIGNELRGIVSGIKAGKYRENGNEYDILVKLNDNQKDIEKNFDSIYVNNINNKLIKLKDVSSIKKTLSSTNIFKKDKLIIVTIEGNISSGGNIGSIRKQAIKIFTEEKNKQENLKKWKNITCSFSGDADEMNDMFFNIITAGTVSIIFIFVILTSLYESIILPFTIMSALPLSIIGGLIALLLSNQPIDMFTSVGMIMLLGIVAKNSILLLDYIQQQIRIGIDIENSILKAVDVRLRPILMTSFTLIAGMLPTALGLNEISKFRRGMGIVIIGGVISSTILTLIVIPALFEYMNNIRVFLRNFFKMPIKRLIDYNNEEIKEKFK